MRVRKSFAEKLMMHALAMLLGYELYCDPHTPALAAPIVLGLWLLYVYGCIDLWVGE